MNLSKHKKYSDGNGFSLMEVMIAMAVLSIVLVAVFNTQSQAVRLSERADYINTAVNLAKARMDELEFEVSEKGFEYLLDKDAGEFENDAFRDYRWEYTSNNISIPLVSLDEEQDTVSDNSFLKMAQEMLEKSIKEVRLRVYFKEGRKEGNVELVTHFSTPDQLPIVTGGADASGGSSGGGS
jgi:prepilin-type N-terminal cleavage/methylation domain-containing protein